MKTGWLKLRWLYKYFLFYRRALTIFDLHAPKAYSFAKAVIEDQRAFYAFGRIASLRRLLLKSNEIIKILDLGAGSKVHSSNFRPVRELARYNAISPQEGEWLFRMVQHFRPRNILELGTSLGISTLYLKLGSLQIPLITVEGSPETAKIARRNLFQLKAGNWELWESSFQQALDKLQAVSHPLDFVYIDGDHRGEATLNYVRQCIRLLSNHSVVVIADIYWSQDMEAAWKDLQSLPEVPLSLDLFHFGILIFDSNIMVKQHYPLVSWRLKPWRSGIGLFS